MCEGNQAKYRVGTLWVDQTNGEAYRLAGYRETYRSGEATEVPFYDVLTDRGYQTQRDVLPDTAKITWWATKDVEVALVAAALKDL